MEQSFGTFHKNYFLFFRLQDGDDGFFEKFGSLLRQKSQIDEGVLKTSLAPLEESSQDGEEEIYEKCSSLQGEKSQIDDSTGAEGSDTSPDGTSQFSQDPELSSTFDTESEQASISEKDISTNVLDAAPVMNVSIPSQEESFTMANTINKSQY